MTTLNGGSVSNPPQPHPALKKKLENFCPSTCYFQPCRQHRPGCRCFLPKDLIVHCCDKKELCVGCNCVHEPGPCFGKKLTKKYATKVYNEIQRQKALTGKVLYKSKPPFK